MDSAQFKKGQQSCQQICHYLRMAKSAVLAMEDECRLRLRGNKVHFANDIDSAQDSDKVTTVALFECTENPTVGFFDPSTDVQFSRWRGNLIGPEAYQNISTRTVTVHYMTAVPCRRQCVSIALTCEYFSDLTQVCIHS